MLLDLVLSLAARKSKDAGGPGRENGKPDAQIGNGKLRHTHSSHIRGCEVLSLSLSLTCCRCRLAGCHCQAKAPGSRGMTDEALSLVRNRGCDCVRHVEGRAHLLSLVTSCSLHRV